MKRILSGLFILIFGVVEVNAQVVLYSTDFGNTVGFFPTGWASSNTINGFESVVTSPSTGYSGASGSINARFQNTGIAGANHTLTFDNALSTIGYTDIRVIWGVRTTGTFIQNVTLEWSSDGINWTPCPFSQTPSGTDWTLVNGGIPIQLPAGAENVSNLRLRWSIIVNNTGNYQIDDLVIDGLLVSGGSSSSDYFRSRQSGNWNASASWESSPDNMNWIQATLIPTATAQTIVVRNGHTITINGNITADQLIVENGAELNHPNTSTFTLNDGAADDLTIYGTYVFYGNSPAGSGNYVVESGGVIRADANTGGTADDLAFSSNARVLFKTGSVFEWNNTSQFGANITYFQSDAERPVFRLSRNIGLAVGGASSLVVRGLFEANGNLTFAGAGAKIFRDGIIGTGTITQQSSSGPLQISGTDAQLGGTGTIILEAAGLQINAGAQVLLVSNKIINNFSFTNNGTFNCQQFIVSGSTSFVNAPGAFLGIGSADGITTGTAGNIQTTGGRIFNSNATYNYNGVTNQVTGNGLPVTVQVLSISSFGGVGNNTITLTTTNTTVDRFNLNTGYFVAGTNGNLNIADGGAVFGTGGHQPNNPVAGTITFLGNGKTEGSTPGFPNLYAVIVNGGVNFNGDLMVGSATVLNRLQINSTAFVQTNAPFYAVGSTLIYNTNGVYSRSIEWGNSVGAQGFPHHVIVQGNTILNLFTNPVMPAQLEIGGNLIIGNENGRGEVHMNNGMNKPLSVLGDVIIGSGGAATSVLQLSSANGGDLLLSGNFIRYNNSSFNPVSRVVVFRGNTTTTISTPGVNTPGISSQDFNYLSLQKTGGASVSLQCAIGIINEVSFISGYIISTNNNLLIFNDNAIAIGANAASFVNGPVRKIGNDAFVFPVGKPELAGPAGGGYRFIGISAPAQITDAFTAEFMVASATALGPLGAAAVSAGLTRVSRCEYWRLSRTNGSATVNVTLSWNARSNCNVSYVSDLPTLAIAHFNGTVWDSFGANSTTGNVTEGSVTWNNVSDFSPFSLASTDFLENVLPLELSVFKVRARTSDVAIDWMLGNNIDYDEYILERSKDGIRFEALKLVQAKVILHTAAYAEEDKNPYHGWNYYRLRTIDKMGRARLSQVEKVWFGRHELIRISPNPASEKILISFAEPATISQIELVNMTGQVIQRVQAVTLNTEINLMHLQAGMYVLRITGTNGLSIKRFIKY